MERNAAEACLFARLPLYCSGLSVWGLGFVVWLPGEEHDEEGNAAEACLLLKARQCAPANSHCNGFMASDFVA